MNELTRREALATLGMGVMAAAGGGCVSTRPRQAKVKVPSYLASFDSAYAVDPRAASRAWFGEARFGLFMHYGLYSQLGRGEWVMYNEKIPVGEYEQLQKTFRADGFDADFITDLALDAGMRYVNLTARHHDSFCLFETAQSDYHSMNSPTGRDLVGELAEQCHKKDLGMFLYYSYALDWRHPYFYPREFNPIARPDYAGPEPRYLWRSDEDFQHYIDFVHGQIRELLTNYGPIAGMWFDPIMGYYARPDLFPIEETYALVRSLQPQTLISFKQGASGDEDFATPEREGKSLHEQAEKRYGPRAGAVAKRAWEMNKDKHNEICDTLQDRAWGYKADATHRTPSEAMEMVHRAWDQNWNLLLNTGPLPDGSIHEADVETLREVGRRLAQDA